MDNSLLLYPTQEFQKCCLLYSIYNFDVLIIVDFRGGKVQCTRLYTAGWYTYMYVSMYIYTCICMLTHVRTIILYYV